VPSKPPPRADAQMRVLREFGARVRAVREERGLTQMSLAHAAGMHPTYLGSVETGQRNVALLNLYALAGALEVELADLLPPRSPRL
jgi:transcriptional regulator with XRE-family HTH domain